MLEAGRPGRLRGAGFYDYDESGKRGSIWSGLSELFPLAEEQIPFQDIKDRLLFAEAIETAKTFEDGVITASVAANIGPGVGIGLPADTGGAAPFIPGYEGDDGQVRKGVGTGQRVAGRFESGGRQVRNTKKQKRT